MYTDSLNNKLSLISHFITLLQNIQNGNNIDVNLQVGFGYVTLIYM